MLQGGPKWFTPAVSTIQKYNNDKKGKIIRREGPEL
jgi:hypothetical protein